MDKLRVTLQFSNHGVLSWVIGFTPSSSFQIKQYLGVPATVASSHLCTHRLRGKQLQMGTGIKIDLKIHAIWS